jgi:hypothetical protein
MSDHYVLVLQDPVPIIVRETSIEKNSLIIGVYF